MNAHVLVVDDEPGVREMLAAWLEAAGCTCAQAHDADEALSLLADRPADVALLDLAMPGQDGIWLARELRERSSDTALIMVTGLQRFDAAVDAMRIGVRDYLLKPFSRQELLQSVRRAVEWRESLERQRAEGLALRAEIETRSSALADAFTALENASAAALEALLVAQTSRSPEKAAHAVRVAAMAVDLAKALGVDEAMQSHIERGALLHDIGKIAMPDALMHKTGPLNEEEITLIRTHAAIGRDIVSTVPALRVPADIVFASHEAWDGSGYPRGLAGTEIPLGSRVIAVVDTFDALTWGRLYRDPVGHARAAAELVRCAGIQFDPDVVRTWLRIAERYPANGRDAADLEYASVESPTCGPVVS
jgi:putative nucleotidyltransferase with HDIG domain